MAVKEFSQYFLCNFNEQIKEEDLGKYCFELWANGQWENLLKFDFLTNHNDGEEVVLQTAIAFLLAFIQENFIGPKLSDCYEKYSAERLSDDIKNVENLVVDGEEMNRNVRYSEFLWCSKMILETFLTSHPNSFVVNWWNMRLTLIHQTILDQLTNSLYEKFKNVAENLERNVEKLNNKELEILLNIEIAQGYLMFQRPQKSDIILEKTCEKFEIQLSVEGLLGMRTKFQQNALPQLCLKVCQTEKTRQLPTSMQTNGKTRLPILLKHDDDTRLEKIKFLNENDNDVITLPSVLQALVLAKLKYLLRSQPKDRLASEEIEPYINTLLDQDYGPLGIRLTSLLLKASQESNHKRTVERCLKQLSDISELIASKNDFTVLERFSYFFASSLPPQWQVKKQLGEVMISLGFIKNALDLYIEIQSWDEVIDCYTHLELRHKAAEIIQNELNKCPSVKLYCLLGDTSDDPKYYEIAWKLSRETSGLAQKHWGNFYFAKKDYETALPHLEKSLEINPLQEVQWLRLGYAAITLEKWELAVQAYLRYTHLEANGFESWNNLAKALIKLGDKKRAHKILQEALKCNFNSWKVWENFMNVSVDTGNFEDAINSYNRLMELKLHFYDFDVLEILVAAIDNDLTDAKGQPCSRLKKNVISLIGKQCIKNGQDWRLWLLAATVAENSLRKAQKFQKCVRAYIEKEKNWTTVKESSIKCLELCLALCENSMKSIADHEESEYSSVNSQLSSARLSVQACIKSFENIGEKYEESEQILSQLKLYFEKLTNALKQRL